jgi:hypothetical protein
MDDRMFRVLVLGGMTLVGCVGCGGIEAVRPQDDGERQAAPAADASAAEADASAAEADASAFPLETNAGYGDATLPPLVTPDAASDDTAVDPVDAAPADASNDAPRFPTEGPPR